MPTSTTTAHRASRVRRVSSHSRGSRLGPRLGAELLPAPPLRRRRLIAARDRGREAAGDVAAAKAAAKAMREAADAASALRLEREALVRQLAGS